MTLLSMVSTPTMQTVHSDRGGTRGAPRAPGERKVKFLFHSGKDVGTFGESIFQLTDARLGGVDQQIAGCLHTRSMSVTRRVLSSSFPLPTVSYSKTSTSFMRLFSLVGRAPA